MPNHERPWEYDLCACGATKRTAASTCRPCYNLRMRRDLRTGAGRGIGIRLSAAELSRLRVLADRYGLTQAETVRRLIASAYRQTKGAA